jgi:hypothetical protein
MRSDQTALPSVGLTQEKLIGRLVVEWSRVEGCLHDIIWRLTGLTFEDGRLLTERSDPTRLIAILNVLGPRYLDEPLLHEFMDALKTANELRDDRNFVAHGSWATILPEAMPAAASLRAKSKPGEVVSEDFPHSRMMAIISEMQQVRIVFIRVLGTLPAPYDDTPW